MDDFNSCGSARRLARVSEGRGLSTRTDHRARPVGVASQGGIYVMTVYDHAQHWTPVWTEVTVNTREDASHLSLQRTPIRHLMVIAFDPRRWGQRRFDK